MCGVGSSLRMTAAMSEKVGREAGFFLQQISISLPVEATTSKRSHTRRGRREAGGTHVASSNENNAHEQPKARECYVPKAAHTHTRNILSRYILLYAVLCTLVHVFRCCYRKHLTCGPHLHYNKRYLYSAPFTKTSFALCTPHKEEIHQGLRHKTRPDQTSEAHQDSTPKLGEHTTATPA